MNPAPGSAPTRTAVVLSRRDGPVLHLTLNRPEARNALSLDMVIALREALAGAEADGTTRVVVLRGAGGHFCAGGDVKAMAAARARLAEDDQAIVKLNQAFGELCVAYADTGLATVAVLEGTVMGGGFGLACVADVALAAPSAVFRLPEASLGLVPAQVAPFLVQRIGYAETKRLALTGAALDAEAALALRLVHAVHDGTELEAALAATLAALLHSAPGAVAATKALLATARPNDPATQVHEAARAFSKAVLGAEGEEGTAAFVARRKPAWAPPG